MSIHTKLSASPSGSERFWVISSRGAAVGIPIDPFMEPGINNFRQFCAAAKRFARRLLIIGENRFELLMVEVQEERERLLRAILLALGLAVFGLLAGLTLTAALVVLLWPYSAVAVLLILTALYGGAAVWLYRRLTGILHDWQNLPATLDQLKKDRKCLETILE
jgi:uncharacterized membrane protein YqjE